MSISGVERNHNKRKRMAYHLRSATKPSTCKNYCELNEIKLPRAQRVKTVDKLYAVEVVEEEGERVKIHYVGYDDRFDVALLKPAAYIVLAITHMLL